jgi:SAM-dependent methyltransferase
MPDAPIDPIAANREMWDGWTRLHVPSAYYDVDGFVADPASRPLDVIERDVVGDVSGKRLLHLQCHFGMDTLRLAVAGARVTGVDFSAEGIAEARKLAERLGIDATFVESDVCDLPAEVPAGAFDVVFTSFGAISWLPDLRPWAAMIARSLTPGGTFHVIDMHPTLWMFDEDTAEPPLPLRYSYFSAEVVPFEMHGTYAAPDADFHRVAYSWQHTFEEIVGSLIAEGLVIESLREYPRIAWRHVPYMTQDADGFWRLPAEAGDVPLMFSLTARKPRA